MPEKGEDEQRRKENGTKSMEPVDDTGDGGPQEDHPCMVNNVHDVVAAENGGGGETVTSSSAAVIATSGEREKWDKKVDFLLSVIGFAVDLANVWRFPYFCYKNGGGAFLVPYIIMVAIGGIPLFYMELVLGQYYSHGAITTWGRICPMFKGIGFAVVMIAFYVDWFYNVILAWCFYFFFASMTSELPWSTCGNPWNTDKCFNGTVADRLASANESFMSTLAANMSGLSNFSALDGAPNASDFCKDRVSPASEFFDRSVLELHKSQGLEDLGSIRWQMALCLCSVYLICYFSLWKGISTSGKVVWFTALFPYMVLFILLIRGVTLPGASRGIAFYLTPDLSRLSDPNVWIDAATQVFFSLGPGFGVLMAFSSYNSFHNNVYYDALATASINCGTSFLAGFVIFSVLGYMAEKQGCDVKDVAKEGPGLVFIAYPEAIATMPGSTFWALLFFMMLITLGLDSSFGGSEAIITGIGDEFPIVKRNRELFVGLLFVFYFVVGIASCAQGGAYFVNLLDQMAAGYSILIAVLVEAVVIGWIYGVDRISNDIKDMIGSPPGWYWRFAWKFFAPIFLVYTIGFGLSGHKKLKYDTYTYPLWADAVGWLIAFSSVACIPGYALYHFAVCPGDTWREKLRVATTPWKDTLTATAADPSTGNCAEGDKEGRPSSAEVEMKMLPPSYNEVAGGVGENDTAPSPV